MPFRSPPVIRRAAMAVSATTAAALLAACGAGTPATSKPAAATSSPATTVTRTVTHGSSTSSQATTTTTTSTPTTGASTTTSSNPSSSSAGNQCVADELSLSFLGGNGATGHSELGFALRNTSHSSCQTGGYPGVLFLKASGQGLPTVPEHTTDDFFGHTTLRPLTVAPGATVSFRLGVTDIGDDGSGAGCVSAKGVQVIPPNDTRTLRVTVSTGVTECGGKVTVSPLQPGTTALR